MRIISGEFGGRRIASPPGRGTRPMLDRVREALFSTLGDLVLDARVLDLFAGTGSLGLEALSRGAATARLVERDRSVVRLLETNVAALGAGDRAVVSRGDALHPTAWGLEDGSESGVRYDLVFFDPPYPFLDDADSRRRVFSGLEGLLRDAVTPDGVVVFHAPKRRVRAVEFGEGPGVEERTYGSTTLWYLTPPTEASAGDSLEVTEE